MKAAIQYGPLVYCAESIDNFDFDDPIKISIDKNADFKIIQDDKTFIRNLDKGKSVNIMTNMLKVNGYINGEKQEIPLVPFYLRGNRNSKSQCMIVWIKEL